LTDAIHNGQLDN